MTRTIRMKDIAGLKANATTAPFVTTEPDKIGGVRGGGSTPVDPPPGGDIDWATRLRKTGSGTTDPTFNPEADIQYIGAFRVPYFSNGTTSTTIKDTIAYKPPEAGGRNGANGSLFLGGGGSGGGGWIGEVQIPDFSNTAAETDYLQLPATTTLQNFVRVLDYAPIQDTGSASPVEIPGALRFIGDTLYMSFFAFYEANADNDFNVLVCEDAKNLATSSYIGLLSRTGRDRGSKYSIVIPPEHQAAFGATDFVGVWASHSIIGRSSFGPALYAWNPAQIQTGDTSVPAVEWAMYGSGPGEQIEFWSYNGQELIDWYEAQVGLPDGRANNMTEYLNYDPSLRISDPSTFTLPDVSLHPGSGHDTQIKCAFIPPGTDSIVFIGSVEGHQYGSLYKAHTWEKGNLQWETNPDYDESAGWDPASIHDQNNAFWTLNVNDVANAVNPYDPKIVDHGVFDGNRWRIETNNGVDGLVSGGCFDPDSGKLYVLHSGLPWNEFEDQKVVSVYQVGGGV